MNKIDQNLIEKFKKAEELFAKKKFDESILNYKEILNSNPSFLPALNNITIDLKQIIVISLFVLSIVYSVQYK